MRNVLEWALGEVHYKIKSNARWFFMRRKAWKAVYLYQAVDIYEDIFNTCFEHYVTFFPPYVSSLFHLNYGTFLSGDGSYEVYRSTSVFLAFQGFFSMEPFYLYLYIIDHNYL